MMSSNKIRALTAACPECDSEFTFKDMPRIGQMIDCASCGTKLEVAYLGPIMLDWADEDVPQTFDEDYDDFDYNSAYG